MSSIEIVVRYSKEIEYFLEEEFGAEGKNLHEKLNDIEDMIPSDLAHSIRKIATTRTKTVYEEGFEIKDKDNFIRECERVIDALYEIEVLTDDEDDTPSSDRPKKTPLWALLLFMLIGAGAGMTFLGDLLGIDKKDELMIVVLGIVGAIGGAVILKQSLKFWHESEDSWVFLRRFQMVYLFLSISVGAIFGFNGAGIGGAIVGIIVGIIAGGLIFYTPVGLFIFFVLSIALLWGVGQ